MPYVGVALSLKYFSLRLHSAVQDDDFDVPHIKFEKSVDGVDIHLVKYKLLETLTCGTSKSSS